MAHKRVALPAGTLPSSVSMEMAERLLSLPLPLGAHPTLGGQIVLHLGRFGPYVVLTLDDNEHDAEPASPVEGASPTRAERAQTQSASRGRKPKPVEPAAPYAMASLPKSVSIWDLVAEEAAAVLDAKLARQAKKRDGELKGKRRPASSTPKAKGRQASAASKRTSRASKRTSREGSVTKRAKADTRSAKLELASAVS